MEGPSKRLMPTAPLVAKQAAIMQRGPLPTQIVILGIIVGFLVLVTTSYLAVA